MISFTVTVCDEAQELDTLLSTLTAKIQPYDEIIVQCDADKVTDEVTAVLSKHHGYLQCVKYSLNNDFASYKNNLQQHCHQQWIVNLDADELPSDVFLDNIHEVLSLNSNVDMFYVPRWNTVEGITQEHITKWGWQVDELGRINFPDLQSRVWKNKPTIQWVGNVHERLMGFDEFGILPNEMYIGHHKSIAQQERQNTFYNTLQ